MFGTQVVAGWVRLGCKIESVGTGYYDTSFSLQLFRLSCCDHGLFG